MVCSTKSRLINFFTPKAIAVIGASREKNKVGRVVFDNLRKTFKGKVIPINVKAKKIAGVKCYPNLLSIKEKVDLVILAIPVSFVKDYVKQAVEKKVKNVVILTAGFSETGDKGAKLEEELRTIVKNKDINVLGPNTLGFINNNLNLNATFASFWPKKGKISFISQSGAFTTTFLDWAQQKGVGVSQVICLGNKIDINEIDILDFLSQDKNTKVITIYLENFSQGSLFLQAANKLIGKKPIIIFKAGKTNLGQERTISHTGKMAGSYEAALAAFEKIKAIVADHIADFFNLIYLFSKDFVIKNKNLIILTNAGGPGVIAVDQTIKVGWQLINPSDKIQRLLKEKCPRCISRKNPIDIIGDASPERFKTALEILEKESCQNILVLVSPQTMTDIPNTAKVIADFSQKTKKNIITCFMGGKKAQQAQKFLKKARCLNFSFPAEAINTLNTAYNFFQNWSSVKQKDFKFLGMKKILRLKSILKKAVDNNILSLNQIEVKEFCQAYQIPLPPQRVVSSLKETIKVGKRFGFPLVLKTQNIHKTDRKEVYLDLNNIKDLIKAFNELKKNSSHLLLQKQINSDLELILGSYQDRDFGPILSFGIGGIYTEIFRKFRTAIPPLTIEEAKKFLKNLEFYELVSPKFRGKKRPFQKLAKLISNFSLLISDFRLIKSVEINPILMTENEVFCVDVRILTAV